MRKILEERLENARNDYGKTTREPQLELKGQIEAYQDCLNLLPPKRTEQEILNDFEALGYEVITNNEIGIILDFRTTSIENGFKKNHYVELERINIYKRTKSYKKDHIEIVNGHRVISDKTWVSMQEHKLLNELFEVIFNE